MSQLQEYTRAGTMSITKSIEDYKHKDTNHKRYSMMIEIVSIKGLIQKVIRKIIYL